jgi:LacI family transcriptional regulator
MGKGPRSARRKPVVPNETVTDVTLRDVAAAAKVHYSTASRALDPAKRWLVNWETAARVQALAEKLGYQPHMIARGLRRGHTNTIGVIVPDLGNPLWAPVLHGIASALEERGFVTLIGETQDDHGRYRRLLDQLSSWRVDAIISAASRLGDRQTLQQFAKKRVPVLLLIRTVPAGHFPSVSDDGLRGGEMAAEHLIQLGHQVLAQLCGPLDVQSFVDRARGFTKYAAAAGVAIVELKTWASTPNYAEGQRLMQELLKLPTPKPTAVFAHNDLMALGAMDVVTAAGLQCPQDISIIGYNDSPLVDHVSPSLSTIRLPANELGYLAGQMIVRLIEAPDGAVSVSIPPTLVARGSTSSLRRSRGQRPSSRMPIGQRTGTA